MPIFTSPASKIKDPAERHARIAEDLSLRAANLHRRADKEEIHEYNGTDEHYAYSEGTQRRFEKVSDRLMDKAIRHKHMAKTAEKLKVYGDGHDMTVHGEGKKHGE